MTSAPSSQREADESWLDDAFDKALAALESGREPDVEELARGNERLRPALEEVLRLAREVVVHPPRGSRLPREFSGYEIERELGSGSMGTVYLARQRSLGGRRVALKVLPPGLGLSSQARMRFLAEARALGGLDHPGIVGVHDVLEADGVVAYAMDWVPGGSLGRAIAAWRARPGGDDMETLAASIGAERAALGAPNAIAWILQAFVDLLRALEAVHARGLLHRDIKPSNVLVSPQGRLLLSDFGLVREGSSCALTRTGEFLGTLQYASPEQRRGQHSKLDARSDVYSAGVTLFEALTLERPFDAPSLGEWNRPPDAGLAPAPRRAGQRLPKDVETILAKTLEPDPARRYGSARELAEDLERFLAFRPILARPASRWQRLSKAALRNRRVLLAAAASASLTVACAVALGAYLWIVPQRLERLHHAAQLELAASARYEKFVALDPDSTPTHGGPSDPAWRSELEGVRTGAERALALDPLRLFDVTGRIERLRDVSDLALAVGSGAPSLPETLARLEGRLRATCALASAWNARPHPAADRSALLDEASADDCYAAGLLGFLLEDSTLAIDAWERLPVEGEVDLLSQGALGQMHLTLERPELASAYLWTALRLAPTSHYLCCELADCAVRLGDERSAERLLEHAAEVVPSDDYDLDRRVQADLLVLRGRLQEARRIYAPLAMEHSGPRLLDHFADLLVRLGEFALEVQVRQANVIYRPGIVRFHEEFLVSAERWWWSLGARGRLAVARALLDGDARLLPTACKPAPDLVDALRRSRSRFESLPATRPWDAPAPRRWSTPRFGPSRKALDPGLLELSDALAWCAAGGAELSSLPPAAKDALVVTLFAPLPALLRRTAALALATSWVERGR